MSTTTIESRTSDESSSEEKAFTALIADDDSIVCQILNFALSQVGFKCDVARDGATAERMVFERDYDLVVADLVMPNKNGHALSVTILEQKVETSIIVHTSVDQTAITKDLIFRGVDDVILKPTNYELLASKALRLVQRKRAERATTAAPSETAASDSDQSPQHPVVSMTTEPVSAEDVQQRLLSVKSLFPLSDTPFKVYSLAIQDKCDTRDLAELVMKDASLSAEVLKVASSAFSSPGGSSGDTTVEKAVVRLGKKQIAEIALKTGGRQALADHHIPWIDRDVLWQKSASAAMAVKIIGEKAGTNNPHDYLSALFHPLGRIILATLYPNLHRKITREALETGKSLDAVELETFGMSSFQVTSICLAAWKIPTNTTMTLQYLGKNPSELSDLPSPLRKRVTIIKLARLLSQIALGLWEDFDLIDLPSSEAVKALQLPSANELIAAIKARYLQEHSVLHSSKDKAEKLTPERIKGMITYFSAGEPGADLLLPLLCSFNLPIKLGAPSPNSCTLINGLDLTSDQGQDLEKKYDKDKLFGVVPPGSESSIFLSDRELRMPVSVMELRKFAKRCL